MVISLLITRHLPGHYSFSKIVYNSIKSASKVHPPDKDMRLQNNEKTSVIKTLFYDGGMDCCVREMKKKYCNNNNNNNNR